MLSKLATALSFTMDVLNPFASSRGKVLPDYEHLDDNRRVFTSPRTQATLLFSLLKSDQDFIRALPGYDDNHLLVFAVCGHQIRVNVYTITEDPIHAPIFNPNWMNEGVFHYRLTPDGMCEQIFRHERGFTYDRFAPLVSYQRDLSVEEEAQINTMRIH